MFDLQQPGPWLLVADRGNRRKISSSPARSRRFRTRRIWSRRGQWLSLFANGPDLDQRANRAAGGIWKLERPKEAAMELTQTLTRPLAGPTADTAIRTI